MTQRRHYTRARGAVDDFVRAHLESDPSEQLALFEEVALARHRCDLAVTTYSEAVESGDAGAANAAGEMMSIELARVRAAVRDAVAVSTAQADKFSVHTLKYVVTKMSRIARETFGEDDPRVFEFERRLNDEVKLPGASGGRDAATDVTPDRVRHDVEEMDEFTMGD